MIDRRQIELRAKRRLAVLSRARNDPRFARVLGRYVAAGLMSTTMDVAPYREPIALQDVLWVARTEPRVLELLPALIVKRPSLFIDIRQLPADVAAAVRALRKNHQPPALRGIPGAALLRWLPAVGHEGKLPSQLKSFRFQHEDLELLQRLSAALGLTQTEVIRRGIRRLAASHLLSTEREPAANQS